MHTYTFNKVIELLICLQRYVDEYFSNSEKTFQMFCVENLTYCQHIQNKAVLFWWEICVHKSF